MSITITHKKKETPNAKKSTNQQILPNVDPPKSAVLKAKKSKVPKAPLANSAQLFPNQKQTTGTSVEDKEIGNRSEGQVQYKTQYRNTKIDGLVPEQIKKNGMCIYSKDQIEAIRARLPQGNNLDTGKPYTITFSRREKEVSQVEVLLLKGIRNQTLICEVLGLSRPHVSGLIKAVEARWEMDGGPRHTNRMKGEAAAKISMMEDEYWELYSKPSTDPKTKVAILGNIVQLIDRKLLLNGLSPRVLEAIALDAAQVGQDSSTSYFTESASVQESLAAATRAAIQLISQASSQINPMSSGDIEDAEFVDYVGELGLAGGSDAS
jgi:hypothetical protein